MSTNKKISEDTRVGLALGGGAVYGAAHIGVLQAIEERPINVTNVSGTSVGAMVASFKAFGVDYEKVKDIALDVTWRDLASISLSRIGILTNKKMHDLVIEHIGDVAFDEADIPLHIIATNIRNGEKKVISEGNVPDAVMASMCIPGLFEPVSIDDELLVDGGIVENVPISPLRDTDCDLIIAVDLNTRHRMEEPNNLVEVLLNSFHFMLSVNTRMIADEADILIQPDLSEFNRFESSQIPDLIKKGYDEACKVLDEFM